MESEIKYRRILNLSKTFTINSIRRHHTSPIPIAVRSRDGLLRTHRKAGLVSLCPAKRSGIYCCGAIPERILRDYEVLLKKKDGTPTYASLTASILTDPDGRQRGVAGTCAILPSASRQRRNASKALRS